MPIQFPSNPTLGQVYLYNGNRWTWDGAGWQLMGILTMVVILAGSLLPVVLKVTLVLLCFSMRTVCSNRMNTQIAK